MREDLHPVCAVCARDTVALGHYLGEAPQGRQLSMDDLIEHLWHSRDPDAPKFYDEADDPF